MGFMQQQIIKDEWYGVETGNGTEYIPSDLAALGLTVGTTYDDDSPEWEEIIGALQDYTECTDISSVELIEGYGARLSAPGYMDCTEWSVFDTEAEAQAFLDEFYGEDD